MSLPQGKLSKREKNLALLSVFLILFSNLIGFGILIPLLPYYAKQFHASDTVVGLLFASFSIAQIFGSAFMGNLSDKFGRKPLLIFSLFGTLAGYLLLAFANSLALLFLSRIIDGLSGGNVTIVRAYISDILEPEERAKGFGIIGAAFGLGFIIGPAIAGMTLEFGYEVPALIASVLTLVSLILAFLLLKDYAPKSKKEYVSPWKVLPRYLKVPSIRELLIFNMLVWTAFSVYQTTFPLFAERIIGLSEKQTGYTLAALGLIGAFTQGFLIRKLKQKMSDITMLNIGLFIVATGVLFLAFSDNKILLALALIFIGTGGGFTTPPLLSIISKKASSDTQGSLQGASGSLESISRIIGPIWGNGLLEIAPRLSYVSPAILLFLLWGYSVFFLRKRKT